MGKEKKYLTFKEAAKGLNISESTFRKNLRRCKYNFTKITKGCATYYISEEIEKYLFEKVKFYEKYFISNEIIELFNISEATLANWRKSGKINFLKADFNHPFLSKGFYYEKKEVLAMKQSMEKVQVNLKDYYSDSETANALHIEEVNLISIRKENLKSDEYILFENHFYYKKTAIQNLINENINELTMRYYISKEVKEILNITSSILQKWRKNGTFSTDELIEYKGIYYYLKERINAFKELQIDIINNYYTPSEVRELLKISEQKLAYLRGKGIIVGTHFSDKNGYLYKKDHIDSIHKKENELNETYYSSIQAGALLDCDSKSFYHLRSTGVIKDSDYLLIDGKYFYKKEKINELVEKDKLIREEYILFKEAAEIISAAEEYFHSLKYNGKLKEPDCLIYKAKNYVKKDFVNNLISKFPKLYEKDQNIAKEELIGEKYITLREAAENLGIKRETFYDLKVQGKLKEPDLLYHKRKYYVKKEYINKIEEETSLTFEKTLTQSMSSTQKYIDDKNLDPEIINESAKELVVSLTNEECSNNLILSNYYTLREVLNLLGISKHFFKKWRENGIIDIERCANINGVLYFEKEYIDTISHKWNTFLFEHYTHVEVLELLNTSDGTIRIWKKSNKIPSDSYKYFFSTCYYEKTVIDNIYQKQKEIDETYVSANALYEKFGLYQHSLNSWVQKGLIDKEKYSLQNVQYNYEPKYIEDFITNYYSILDLTLCISTKEIANSINYSVEAVNEFISEAGTNKTYKINDDIFISFEEIPKVFEHFMGERISSFLFDKNHKFISFHSYAELETGVVGPKVNIEDNCYYLRARDDYSLPDGYELLKNRTQMEEVTSLCFSHLFSYFIKNGILSTVRKWVKIGDKYERVLLYNKEELDQLILFRQNGISHKEISKRLKIGLIAAKGICLKTENFGKCYEYPEGYIVDRRDYIEFEQMYKMKYIQNFVNDFLSLPFYEQLRERINQIIVPSHLYKTVEDFLGFAATRLNKLKGSDRTLYNNTTRLSQLFYRIIKSLSVKNISDLNDEQLLLLAKNEKFIPSFYRLLVKFTEWLKNNRQCNFNHPLSPIEQGSKKEDDKEIYTPEEYMLYFEFLLDIEKHIPIMLKSRGYTSVWIYTAIHMNCVFRGVDIMKLPTTNIKALNILGLDFFKGNCLNEAQISIIINQITSLINSVNFFAESKKNNSTYVFTVHPLFYESIATALVIANLHRELESPIDNDEPLLRYGNKIFDEINGNEVDKEFKKTYKKVLDTDPIVLPKFSTRKMNTSFLTYMHHALVETSGIHPALATAYLSRWRGHKNKNSILHYILMNDFDGTYEDACIRLFSRGQFGWVYESLIKSLKIDEKTDQKEKTLLIRNLQSKYELIEIEEIGLSIVMSVKQKENVMNFLLSKSKKELLELSLKIFSGDFPAKVEAGSCLVGRENCPIPELDCLHGGCEYYIPNNRILNYIEKEFHITVKEYLTTKYETKKIKHAQWLKKIIIIVLQAINGLGIDLVKSFIDYEKMIEICGKIDINKWDNKINLLEKKLLN